MHIDYLPTFNKKKKKKKDTSVTYEKTHHRPRAQSSLIGSVFKVYRQKYRNLTNVQIHPPKLYLFFLLLTTLHITNPLISFRMQRQRCICPKMDFWLPTAIKWVHLGRPMLCRPCTAQGVGVPSVTKHCPSIKVLGKVISSTERKKIVRPQQKRNGIEIINKRQCILEATRLYIKTSR